MGEKYNAFISYKHSELDSKIASEIQRQLERFKIPSSIKKISGKNKINRVFRDKEELTLTSDLSATIENALINSDHLIVICSNATKESIWVQREIEYFLKSHSRKQILTVVTEGEPCDVVPEILQYKEEKVIDSSGNTVITKVPTEFLACDYRGELKKAHKDELPRLAAALIGCNYDDLVQRQKQYRRKKRIATLSIVGTLLVMLTTYFAFTSYRINKNYEQSLLNQSEYLAAESTKLYENGDRVSAALLALEALPNDDFDRPLSNKALNALSDAIYAYRPMGISDLMLSKSFKHSGEITDYVIDEKHGLMATVHSLYYLTIWDLETGKELYSCKYTVIISKIDFLDNGNLVVLSDNLACLDTKTFQTLWTVTNSDTILKNDFVVSDDSTKVVLAMSDYISIIDSKNGEENKQLRINNTTDVSNAFAHVAVSKDGKYIAACESTGIAKHGKIIIWNIDSGEYSISDFDVNHTKQLMFTQDNYVVCLAEDNITETSLTYTTLTGYDAHMLHPGLLNVYCIDVNGKTIYKESVSYKQQYYGVYSQLCDDNLYCAVGNICKVFDTNSGATIKEIELPSPIISLFVKDNNISAVLSDGSFASYSESIGYPVTMDYFVDDLNMATLGKYITVVQFDSSDILLYDNKMYDETWQNVKDFENNISSIDESYQIGNYLVCKGESLSEEQTVYCIDTKNQKLLWTISDNNIASIIPATDLNKLLILTKDDTSDSKIVKSLELKDGSSTVVQTEYEIYNDYLEYKDNYIYYIGIVMDNETNQYSSLLCKTDVNTKNGDTTVVDTENKNYSYFHIINNDSYILWKHNANSILCINGKIFEKAIEYPMLTQITEDNIIFIDNNDIVICDENLIEESRIPLYDKMPLATIMHENNLLVTFDDTFCRYDMDGNTLENFDILSKEYGDNIVWDFYDDKLALKIDDKLNIIDTKKWELYTSFKYCIGFASDIETAYILGFAEDSERNIGYFKIYSPDELIEKATKMLDGFSLTEKQKSDYGLN